MTKEGKEEYSKEEDLDVEKLKKRIVKQENSRHSVKDHNHNNMIEEDYEDSKEIYKFTEYDSPLGNYKRKHVHVFNRRHNGSRIINSNNDKAISNKCINSVLESKHSMDGPIY